MTGAGPGSSSSDLPALAEQALAATVVIGGIAGSHGSGFVVHPDGLIVTARHVIEDGDHTLRCVPVYLVDKAGRSHAVAGTVFRSHRQLDYALLWLLADGPFPTLPLGSPAHLRPAQTLLAVGAPAGLDRTVARGIVANPARPVNGIEYIQTDADITPGNSGGPLVASDGAIGISVWIIQGVGAARFALPIDYLTYDIMRAVNQGRYACITARYCTACGNYDTDPLTFYCRACGRSHVQANDDYIFADFTCTILDGQSGRPLTIRLSSHHEADVPMSTNVAEYLDGSIDGNDFVPFAHIFGRLYLEWPTSRASTASRLALETVLSATDGAFRYGQQYAHLSGRCFVCGTGLTSDQDRSLGACARCANEYGFPWEG